MFAQVMANLAAVGLASKRIALFHFRVLGCAAVVAAALSGCSPTTIRLVGSDPADPKAQVSGVGNRSTVAPYTRLRPAAPSPWREQNDRAAPAPKSGQ